MKATSMSKQQLIGSIITITSLVLCYVWFGWELFLIVSLAFIGNNLVEGYRVQKLAEVLQDFMGLFVKAREEK